MRRRHQPPKHRHPLRLAPHATGSARGRHRHHLYHHGQLVPYVTSPRIISHEPTYHMLRANRDDCASRDGDQQGSGNAHHAPRNHHGRHGVGYGSCADSKRRSDAPLRCPPADNNIDPQAPSRPSPREGTEKLPLFPFYRRVQTSLPGVYEAFWLRCVVRVKSKNRPREGLETLPNGFLGDVLADM